MFKKKVKIRQKQQIEYTNTNEQIFSKIRTFYDNIVLKSLKISNYALDLSLFFFEILFCYLLSFSFAFFWPFFLPLQFEVQ